jgi:voltage-gated potassium channel
VNAAQRSRLKELYFGDSKAALRFQSAMLLIDLTLIGFFIVAPFIERDAVFFALDYAIAAIVAIDLVLRSLAFGDLRRWLRRPLVWADMAVLASLIAPVFAANLGFLRIMRLYSMAHGDTLWRAIGGGRWVNTNAQDLARAATNLGIFIFVATSLVHAGFAGRATHINSYLDSLYFTVATLSTTGYGDIVLPGARGKILSIVIMIGGASLFIRLAQVTLRSGKVRFRCSGCGLLRHDNDASHCKACGERINIPHDND